ncbi:HD domain-containing protein [Gaiella occulta]|uniref:HD domain-containing protein n=1 Tax=Gaiella occulta TaxID=1002870 RepID=A0A7M2YWZ5_9ACTN|nr:HD domain-containing phosphohydrolase [Gaiella occulta]RDI73988.1 HD domain-containing protein [Gaiella occulta]
MHGSTSRPGLAVWVATVVAAGSLIGATSVGPVAAVVWDAPLELFSLVVVTAALCVLASAAVVVVGMRDDTAEVGLLGGSLLGLSLLALAHGIAVPGVLYGPNTAVTATTLLSLPVAVAIASPLLASRTGPAQWVARRWRRWVAAWIALVVGVSALLLALPSAFGIPGPRHPATVAVAAASVLVMLTISYGQLRLYWVGELRATLVGALGFAFIGVTAIQWVGERPFSLGFWIVHLLDTVGVLAACGAVALGHRAERPVRDLLAPIVERDPLATLELGLAPVVRRFVAALDAKDPQTRDHVVRVAETAMRVGERLRVEPRRLRYLGLAALLHDVGKLTVDDAILKKPGRLTNDQYERIKRHTSDGEKLLLAARELAPAAGFVRSHHERVDGRGYPDGLSGEQIPLEARIIAASDAYDAIVHTRHYRDGLGKEAAASILEEHAGSQWDADVVAVLLAVVEEARASGSVFWRVGREPAAGIGHEACATCATCADALPVEVAELLAALSS